MALQLEKGNPCSTTTEEKVKAQAREDILAETTSTEAYRKLIRTAYELAMSPHLPLKTFELLVKCQRENGVKLIQGTII